MFNEALVSTREHCEVLSFGLNEHAFVPHLFPLFSQVFYALHQLVVVVLKRGPLLSHGRSSPALPFPARDKR